MPDDWPTNHRKLERLAELRPLIAGGYIGFFSENWAKQFRYNDPDIAEEGGFRADGAMAFLELALYKSGGITITEHDREESRDAIWPPWLDRLAASVGLGLDVMDVSEDRYVLKYLGKDLTAFPTKLDRFRFPDSNC